MATEFDVQIDEWVKATGLELGAVQRRLSFEILDGVVRRTPVDTGLLRSNWHVSIGTPSEARYAVGASGNTRSRIDQATGREAVYIQNNMPYARRIEYGWSKQAPNGMVRPTLGEVQANLERIIKANR